MSDQSKIEWTDATCPCDNSTHGITHWGAEGGSEKGWSIAGGVSAASRRGREALRSMPRLAPTLGVRRGFEPGRRLGFQLLEGAKRDGQAAVQAARPPVSWKDLRPATGWGLPSGASQGQSLRRGWVASEPQRTSVHRLRARLAARGSAS